MVFFGWLLQDLGQKPPYASAYMHTCVSCRILINCFTVFTSNGSPSGINHDMKKTVVAALKYTQLDSG